MDIKKLFEEALLAQVAYIDNLVPGMKGDDLIDALLNDEDNNITQAQAEYFASKYIVVQQSEVPEPDTGFSATLFKNIETQEYHLANRGSDGIFDVDFTSANAQNLSWGMSYDQVADLINFYHRITQTGNVPQFTFEEQILDPGTPPPEGSVFRYNEYNDDTQEPTADVYLVFKQKLIGAIGFGEISNTEQLNVSGHSLGGHLASAFSLLFPSVISQTSTFNSAGIVGDQFDELASAIAEVLAIVPSKVAEPNVNVIDIKSPLDPVSSLGGLHLGGGLVDVFIEAEDTLTDLESHDMDRLVDSLAVMNLLYTLDNSFTLAKGNELLPLGSSDEYTELEGVMNYLAKLFDQGKVAIIESDHDVVYSTIKKITDSLGDKTYQISEITSVITDQALAGDKAALYALINLQPFVVRGSSPVTNDALYQSHSDDGALDIENYTEEYLADRAVMLQWLIKYNDSNTAYGEKLNPDDFTDTNGLSGNFEYTDMSSGAINSEDLVLKIDGDGATSEYDKITFGTQGNDTDIIGGSKNDRLYGGAGDDHLYGKEGDDYLDGGAGDDYLEAGEEDEYGDEEAGVNILDGGAGHDILIGGDGVDLLYGGEGSDILFVDRGALHVVDGAPKARLGTELMNGGEGVDLYYIGTSSNYTVIEDSDGEGGIFVKASGIGDNRYLLVGGGFWGEQTTDQGLEADGYTQIHFDGLTSNYTVAYELDGSQTLIAYGFNIPNFYNGMLGINLVGGRVDTGSNVVDDVLDKIVFDDQFTPDEIKKIKEAIQSAYEKSPIARKMLRDYAIVGDNDININFSEGEFSSSVDGVVFLRDTDPIDDSLVSNNAAGDSAALYIDLKFLENNTYISTTGQVVEDSLETALIHELVHMMTGLHDTPNPGEKGDTVVFANTIYKEMGLAEQVSYLAYDPSGQTHITNFEYTQGQAIDRAFTLWSENSSANDFDSTIGGYLDDLIIGNERENTLKGGDGNDFLYGGAGDDFLRGNDGNDHLSGDDGDDYLFGEAGNDEFIGGLGDDFFYGEIGDDLYIYSYGDGNDKYGDNASGIDTISFTDIASTDVKLSKKYGSLIFSFTGSTDQITFQSQFRDEDTMDFFKFSDGVAWDASDILTQLITGTNGDDFLYGDDNNNELNAFAGNDELYGEDGNDVLNGGSGDDLLYGGDGNDTYIFNVDNGNDEIIDYYGEDSIQFGDGITASDLTISYSLEKIIISVNSDSMTDDAQILIKNTLQNNIIEKLIFSNGDTVLWDPVEKIYVSNDINAEFIESEQTNIIYGNVPEGPVNGTKENDLLIGLIGAHTYYIDIADGHDVIDDTANPGSKLVLERLHDWQISAVRDGNDMVINVFGPLPQSIRILEQYNGNGLSSIRLPNQTITDPNTGEESEAHIYYYENLGDREPYSNYGTFLVYRRDMSELIRPPYSNGDSTTILGTEWSETIIGTDENDIIDGGKGDDLLKGGKGDDTYNYDQGDGNDVIEDNGGFNHINLGKNVLPGGISLWGGLGNDADMIIGMSNGEQITLREWNKLSSGRFNRFSFSDGTIWEEDAIWSNIVITGTEGDDSGDYKTQIYGTNFELGLGNDTIYGGKGDDTYLYNLGDGHDIIKDKAGLDTLRFGAGITADNISVSANDTDMLITLSDGQVVTIANWYQSGSTRIEKFEFSDGTVWTAADILTNMVIAGTDGIDTINNKRLVIGTTYEVGLGDDIVHGGKGDDAYFYNLSDGNDTIKDKAGSDSLRFGAGITADNISVSADGTNMLITLSDGQVVTIANWYQSGSTRIEQFEFSDGTLWLAADMLTNMVIAGTEGSDTIINKRLVNGTSYDMGLGDDIVYGGKGDDVYFYNLGDGNDIINDKAGLDSLCFGAGITAENISVSADGTNMLITLSDGQVVTIANWYQSGSTRIEQFEFSDGTLWLASDMLTNMVIAGTEGSDTIINKRLVSGTSYDMGLGDDIVYGGKGDDVYFYNLGDGNDIINDKAGLDSLCFGAGITAENISVSTNDTDMLITLSDGQVVTIANWYQSGSTRIEQFEFSDGSLLQTEDIISTVSGITTASEASSIDSNLNLLIQSYSSFDGASDEAVLELSKIGSLIILPVIENTL